VHDDRPEASDLLNLAALCQKCHNGHDMKARRRGIIQRQEAASPQYRFEWQQ
jgi:5-methylcytosine-specific restriction endonuclease McrA